MSLRTQSNLGGRGLLWMSLLAMALISACEKSQSAATPPATSTPQLVQVDFSIHYDGRKPDIHLEALKVVESATVYDALETAANQCGFRITSRGTDSTLFVSAIDEVENEGAGGKNWIYRVNGELGNSSSGVFVLKANDRIEWSLGDYPEK